MILVDTVQIMISTMYAESKGKPTFNPDLIRHMFLNTLRGIRKKFKAEYGELVLCYDAGNYWRRDIFPFYKASRKAKREESTFPWDDFFKLVGDLRTEVAENFPYKILYVPRCETDDIIAVWCKKFPDQKTMIISGDTDFVQLQSNPNVKQYSWIHKKLVDHGDPGEYLNDLVMHGDVGDGIPNILSDADAFVNENKRQKPLTKKRIADIQSGGLKGETLENFIRNKMLIDFTMIPVDIQNTIVEHINAPQTTTDGTKVLGYMAKYGMRRMIEVINDFV